MTTSVRSTSARKERLLKLLADGQVHPGEQLAKRLRISRAGVWKLVQALRELGIDIESDRRAGYRLPHAVDLYSAHMINEAMTSNTRARLDSIDTLLSVDSTNRYLAEQTPVIAGKARLCVAELQTAGRGRRGRSWLAPFGSGICASLAWQFDESPPTFSALSLAVGVAVVRSLRRFGADKVGLKWPNDIVWQGRKLAGILIELRGESQGPAQAIIGIGLNVRLPASTRITLAEQQATLTADVREILRERAPERNALLGAIVDELINALLEFQKSGFTAFAQEWAGLDALRDVPIKVISSNQTLLGTARGVAEDGALLVEINDRLERIVSADVSLRALRPAQIKSAGTG